MKNIITILLLISLFVSCEDVKETKQMNEKAEYPKDLTWNYNPAEEWEKISFDQTKIDSIVIDSIDQRILKIQKQRKDFRSFLVVVDNKLLFEKYYDGGGINELNSLKSVTKSITSLLTGKAIDLNLIKNVDQEISEFFPEYFTEVDDSLKNSIRIKNLLTMSAGFRWNNFGGKYRSGWDLYKGNRHEYMITKTVMENKPGEIFNYNSGLSHMLSGIITNESTMKTDQFAEKYLFEPLGIKKYKWTADRNGYNLGNSELFLTSRAMAKIGLLVLNKGYWFDKQIIDSTYVKEMLSPQIKTEGIGQKYCQNYGYQWWVKDYKNIRINFAAGYGGQYIFVIPKLKVVIVFTTNWQTSDSSFQPLRFVNDFIDSQI